MFPTRSFSAPYSKERSPLALKKSSKGYSNADAPSGIARYILVCLAPGWALDKDARAFISDEKRIDFAHHLPRGARARPHVPALASRDVKTLSEAERALARYVQLLLPKNADIGSARAAIAKLEAVEEATVSPEVGLP